MAALPDCLVLLYTVSCHHDHGKFPKGWRRMRKPLPFSSSGRSFELDISQPAGDSELQCDLVS